MKNKLLIRNVEFSPPLIRAMKLHDFQSTRRRNMVTNFIPLGSYFILKHQSTSSKSHHNLKKLSSFTYMFHLSWLFVATMSISQQSIMSIPMSVMGIHTSIPPFATCNLQFQQSINKSGNNLKYMTTWEEGGGNRHSTRKHNLIKDGVSIIVSSKHYKSIKKTRVHFDIKIKFKDLEFVKAKSFEMNQTQTCKGWRILCWMDVTCNTSLW